jgi:hypothetical protein
MWPPCVDGREREGGREREREVRRHRFREKDDMFIKRGRKIEEGGRGGGGGDMERGKSVRPGVIVDTRRK